MDRYTKTLLTIIALSLLWLSVRGGVPVADLVAAVADTRVDIADVSVSRTRPLPVTIVGRIECTD